MVSIGTRAEPFPRPFRFWPLKRFSTRTTPPAQTRKLWMNIRRDGTGHFPRTCGFAKPIRTASRRRRRATDDSIPRGGPPATVALTPSGTEESEGSDPARRARRIERELGYVRIRSNDTRLANLRQGVDCCRARVRGSGHPSQ